MKPNENQKVSLYNQAINQLKTPDDNFNRILFSSFVKSLANNESILAEIALAPFHPVDLVDSKL